MVVSIPAYVSADDDTAIVNLTVNVVSPPVVFTLYPIGIGTTKATLLGWLADTGTGSSVQVKFGWDTVSHAGDPSGYANWTVPQLMTKPGCFNKRIYSLEKHTFYYFRAVAVGDTTAYGGEYAFATHPRWSDWWFTWWSWFH
jgi:hypothetical protein